MSKLLIEYLLFIGLGLYAGTTVMFFWLFTRTLRTKDGIGLMFLKFLTLGIFLGSGTITVIRYCNLFVKGFDPDFGRAIAVVNPLTLLGMGLYLNFLFHQKYKK